MEKDSLSPALITDNLKTRFIGQKVLYYPQLTSTMDIARQEALRGAAEGTAVVADEQTGGRGRVKRLWLSPQGSIAISIILYPGVINLPYLIMLASLAVASSIEAVTGLKPSIKWPNDVLVNGKKACGILIENKVKGKDVLCAIIGIGINVNFRPADFDGIPPTATSLAGESGGYVSRLDLIRRLLVETEGLYLRLPDAESIYRGWRSRLETLGRKVQVKSGKTTLEGIAESVAGDGSLLLRHSNGSSTRIVAGDVSLRNYE